MKDCIVVVQLKATIKKLKIIIMQDEFEHYHVLYPIHVIYCCYCDQDHSDVTETKMKNYYTQFIKCS